MQAKRKTMKLKQRSPTLNSYRFLYKSRAHSDSKSSLIKMKKIIFFSRSITVVSQAGYKLFAITATNKVEEIWTSENVNTKIAERLFSSSLVAVVTNVEPNKLKVRSFLYESFLVYR